MSVWNKVLMGLIIVASLCFAFFAMRALKTHQYWRGQVQSMQNELERLRTDNVVLAGDSDDHAAKPGIRQKKLQLHKLMLNRGRVWTNVAPNGYNAETGALSVTTDLPNPNGIEVGAVLHLFAQAPISQDPNEQGGQFLGTFTVTAKAEKQLQLQPSAMMTRPEVDRLQNSPGPWMMYDILPADDRESFATLDEKAKRAILPKETVEEYINEGKAQPDGTKATRQLRDYGVLFTTYHRERVVLFEMIAAAKTDLQYLQNALTDAHKQVQFHNAEINTLKADLAEEERQLAALNAHLKAVEDKLAEVRGGVQQLIDANRATAGRIAWIQMEATRQIDERTHGMAQTTQ